MHKYSSKKDVNQLAASIVKAVIFPIASKKSSSIKGSKQKNLVAVTLVKLGGLKSSKLGGVKLTEKQGSEMARSSVRPMEKVIINIFHFIYRM